MSGRNIEIKCRCGDLDLVQRLAEALGARAAAVLRQCDTFFVSPQARLKLRDFGDGRAELIAYRRADSPGARASDYVITGVSNPVDLAAVLSAALETSGVVRKTRRLLLYRHTRIHLDEVEGLGTFVELETVLSGQSEQEGHQELQQVATALNLRAEDHVAEPYVELLRSRPGGEAPGSRA